MEEGSAAAGGRIQEPGLTEVDKKVRAKSKIKGSNMTTKWSCSVKSSKAGWKERWKRFMGGVKSVYTMAKCKRHLSGFDLASFKSQVSKLYENVNRMLAEGDRSGLGGGPDCEFGSRLEDGSKMFSADPTGRRQTRDRHTASLAVGKGETEVLD